MSVQVNASKTEVAPKKKNGQKRLYIPQVLWGAAVQLVAAFIAVVAIIVATTER